jgi:hypothetical protein
MSLPFPETDITSLENSPEAGTSKPQPEQTLFVYH